MATVLIVEDEPMIQDIFSSCFEWGGHKVLFADTVEGAKKHLKDTDQIDIVLIDGYLKHLDRGDKVATYIVEDVWPRQRQAEGPLTPFVTMGSAPFYVTGTSHAYLKTELLQLLIHQKDSCNGWIREMKKMAGSGPRHPEQQHNPDRFYALRM